MIKKIFITICTLISSYWFFASPSSILATNYYIDATNGSNSNNGTSENTAWQTLAKASASPVTSGDTILLKRGETWSGTTLTPAAGTTIDAYGTGAKPVIDGTSSVARSISIAANNVTVSNITVKGATSSMVFIGATGAILNDVDSTGNPIAYRVNSGSATFNRVTSTSASNAAYFVENSSTVTINTATSTTTTTGNGFRAINSSTLTCNDCTASGSLVDGFSISNSAVLTCNRCKAYNNGSTGDSTSGDGFTSHDTSTLNVRYSIAYGNYKSGIAVTGSSSGEILNSTFYNNVESTNGSGWDSSGDLGIGINATGTWTVKNNITYGHPVEFMISAVSVSGGASVTSNYNLFYDSLGGTAFDYNNSFYNFSGYKTASGKDTNSLNTNPLLRNVSASDFYLISSSPAINSGTDVGLTIDYYGTTVPQGAAVDIGAVEYVPTSTGTLSFSSSAPMPCTDKSPSATPPYLYQASPQDSNSLILYFTSAGDPVDKYALEYGTISGNYKWGVHDINIDNNGDKIEFVVEKLKPNTIYYFRVRGGNGCATGPWSNELSAKTLSNEDPNHSSITTINLNSDIEKEVEKSNTITQTDKNQNNTNNQNTIETKNCLRDYLLITMLIIITMGIVFVTIKKS